GDINKENEEQQHNQGPKRRPPFRPPQRRRPRRGPPRPRYEESNDTATKTGKDQLEIGGDGSGVALQENTYQVDKKSNSGSA
ncbi:hypothetical protein, partial [Staphylococcus aureus]|uniref:hypothetical protein n=1 Tax=Staphylococcus aureus TaxID=1280 RepID=UPI0038B29682